MARATRGAAAPVTTRTAVERALAQVIAHYDDVERPALRDTPARMARMYTELLTPKPFAFTTFDAEGADQMVVERDIPFYSLCEHHLLPFFGTATVAYIPHARIAGLSKLARAVDHCAHALQTQERLGEQIADLLVARLEPVGVGVVLCATHLCMAMRGVCKPGAVTVTSALRGAMREKPETRAEFLTLAHAPAVGSGMGRGMG